MYSLRNIDILEPITTTATTTIRADPTSYSIPISTSSPSTITSTIVSTKFKVEDIIVDINSLSSNYECQICFESIIDLNKPEVLQCKEGHMFCRNCWVTSLSTRKSCMHCRTPINSISELSRNRYIEKEFSEKLVRCPNSVKGIYKSNIGVERSVSFDSLSPDQQQLLLCNQQPMKIELLNQHLKNCEFQLLSCDLCEKKFKKSEVTKHQDECIYVKVVCSYCNKSDIARYRLNEHHTSVCPNFIVECDSCKNKIKRNESTTHKQDECPNTIVECKYVSCCKRLERSKMVYHSIDHLSTIFSIINQQRLKIDQQSIQLQDTNRKYDELLNKFNNLEMELRKSNKITPPPMQDSNKKYDELLNKFNILEIDLKNVKSKQITPPQPPKTKSTSVPTKPSAPAKPSVHTSPLSKLKTKTTNQPPKPIQPVQKFHIPISKKISENRLFGRISIPSYTSKSLLYRHKSYFESEIFSINNNLLNYKIRIYPNGIAGSQAKLSIVLIPNNNDESNFNFGVALFKTTTVDLGFTRKSTHTIDSTNGVFVKDKEKVYGFPRFISSKDILTEIIGKNDLLELEFELTVGDSHSDMALFTEYENYLKSQYHSDDYDYYD